MRRLLISAGSGLMMILQGFVHLWSLKIVALGVQDAISIRNISGRVCMMVMDMHHACPSPSYKQIQSAVEHV